MKRWIGLAALLRDVVDGGSKAVEGVQKSVARLPFAMLEAIPPIAVPARVVHVVHDASVGGTHAAIRAVNAVAGKTLEVVLAQLDRKRTGG